MALSRGNKICTRHSFILTRAGKVLDGAGLTDSHTEIREFHGLNHTDDTVNAYEWQPPKGWPDTDWFKGLTKDAEVFVPKSSHLEAMERHVKKLYPTMAEWDAGDKPRPLSSAEQIDAEALLAASEFVTVPETTLPNGLVVPSFRTFKYLASRGQNTIPISNSSDAPWVNINFLQTRAIVARAGLECLHETQALAIAWDISQQDINWTGGKVGEGHIYQGLHKGTVSRAQPGNSVSTDPEERRWHQLSNGDRIYDVAGNAFSWIVDDVQGNEQGIVAKKFAKESPSIATAPYPSREKGMGWRPSASDDWSGFALIRSGCWYSGGVAGVFCLYRGWPVCRFDFVGFRCTLP